MSVFDESLSKAKRRRQLLVFSTFALLLLLLLGYITAVVFAKGYALTVLPDTVSKDARINVISGWAWGNKQTLYTLSESTLIEVSAPLYQTQRLRIDSATPTAITVELVPQPAQVTLTTSLEDEQTQWFIDGELIDLGNSVSTELSPGTYLVKVEHPFYETSLIEIVAEKASTIQQNIELKRLSGSVFIATDPVGADIAINGENVGSSPLNLPLPAGAYDITVTKNTYQSIEENIRLTKTALSPQRRYRLERLNKPLLLNTEPSDGVLLINGQVTTANRVEVPIVTPINIEYRKPGYLPYKLTQTYQDTAELEVPIVLSPELGVVEVDANVSAEVWVNGVLQGQTPMSVNLKAISHTIEIKRAGYRTMTYRIMPDASSAQRLNVALLTEFSARRRDKQPLFIDALGIEMKAFQPENVLMGAAINDSQRRSNEHQIRVEFTRPIWVAKHEVTQSQYSAMPTGTPTSTSTLPQTNITWEQAARYCNWLSQQEALPAFYIEKNGVIVGFDPQASGYRLLTEAEWEWVARMSNRARQTRYVWGNSDALPRGLANVADSALLGTQPFVFKDYEDSHPGIAPVGSYRADRAGLYDLVGNAAEWVHDRYTLQPPNLDVVYSNYTGPVRGADRVIKGGHYKTGRLKELRASYRSAGSVSPEVGFRIARYFYEGQ